MFVELGYEAAGDVDVSFKSASTVRVNSPTGNAELPRAGLINRYACFLQLCMYTAVQYCTGTILAK